jgi:hypothetical protein
LFKTTAACGAMLAGVAVTDFDTKVAVIVRDDLAGWQRLNVCAFLMSGVSAAAGSDAIGEDYRDADRSWCSRCWSSRRRPRS